MYPDCPRRPQLRHLATALLFAGVALPAPAFADGAKNVATAPVVVPRTWQTSNTGNGFVMNSFCAGHQEWWRLDVVDGDSVAIEWRVPTGGSTTSIAVFPVGVTDFTADNGLPVEQLTLAPGEAQTTPGWVWKAGAMPLKFYACGAGAPYSFRVTLKHNILLDVPGLGAIAPSGLLAVGVRSPVSGGSPLTDSTLQVWLEVRSHGDADDAWARVGTASAEAGVAKIPYDFSAALVGGAVDLRVVAEGPTYGRASTRVQTIEPPTPTLASTPPAATPSPVPVSRTPLPTSTPAVRRSSPATRLIKGKVLFEAKSLTPTKPGSCPKLATVSITVGKSRVTKKLKVTSAGKACQLSGTVKLAGKLAKSTTVTVSISSSGIKSSTQTVKAAS